MTTDIRIPPKEMERGAGQASAFLKTLAHETRLRILCLLATGEHTVGQLVDSLNMRQAAVSQQLQRLRAEHLVKTRRQGKEIHYSLASHEVEAIMEVLHRIYCGAE